MALAYLPPIMPPARRSEDLILHTLEVYSRGERRQFAAVGRHVYRSDPRWTPALPYARQAALAPGNPLFPSAAAAGFVALGQNLGLGDEAVGTIGARAAPGNGLERAVGEWGLFDALNLPGLSERLFSDAETWLFEHTRGIAALSGPAGMEPLTPGGLLIDGFDAWPAALLPYNPPCYPEAVEAEGYEPSRLWSVWRFPCPVERTTGARHEAAGGITWERTRAAYEGYGLPDDAAPGLGRWLEHVARQDGFPAHPHLRWVLAQAFRRALTVTAGDGVCFGIPDFAPALRLTGGRLFPIGYIVFRLALARARRLRVFPAAAPEGWNAGQLRGLYDSLAGLASRRGYAELVIAPIPDTDTKSAEALDSLGARVIQRFAIYEKTL